MMRTEETEGAADVLSVLVLAPLRASGEHATNDSWTVPLRFTRADFDEVMATVAPAIDIDVEVSAAERKLRTTHAFRAMKSFRPDVLMEQASILRALRAGASNVPPPMPSTEPASAKPIDQIRMSDVPSASALEATLAALIAHPEVRSLERAWRGLHFLADRADKTAVIEAIDASLDNVEAVLTKLAARTEARPIDLIVVDHWVGAGELPRLEKWAMLAARIGAPLVANALPELLAEGQRDALRSAAATDAMRWVTLAMNGPLARPRHSGPVKRTFGVIFDEKGELCLGAAVGVATLAVQAFAKDGWACPPTGVVGSLPVHIVNGESIATETRALADAASEAAQAGIALFCSAKNEDVAILPHAPSLHPGVSLGDQLFLARVGHAITKLAAAIPASTPEDAARDVVKIALGQLFGESPKLEIHVKIASGRAEVTIRPRGFQGVKLEEATLSAPLA